MTLHTFYWIVSVLACAPLAYYLLSIYCVAAHFRELRRAIPAPPCFHPPVSILKPVRGADFEAYENFASYCRLDYPEYEIIFAVAESDDPAVPVIERLQADFPKCSIRLIKGVAKIGSNNKVNSLCRLAHEAKYELVVMSDSDVRVDSDYLRVAAAPFADPQVGAVTALYRCITGGGLGADLQALGMWMDSAPGALTAQRLENKLQFAFGWTMATTKTRLAEIGGWESMANFHSDDFELGNRISRSGYRVELMNKPVWMVFPRESMGHFLQHEMRWSIGLKNVRPVGYLALVLTHGLPWAIVAASIAASLGWPGIAALYLVAYFVLRLGLAWTTAVWGLGETSVAKKLWLIPVRDAVNFIVWLGAFLTDQITWRGQAFRVRNRMLFPVPNVELRESSASAAVEPDLSTPRRIL
jgi:ceramide glucosyltransferase